MRTLGFEAMNMRTVITRLATTGCVITGLSVGYFSGEQAALAFPPQCYLFSSSPITACECTNTSCGNCVSETCGSMYTTLCAYTWPHVLVFKPASYVDPSDVPCWTEWNCEAGEDCVGGCGPVSIMTGASPVTITIWWMGPACP